MMLRRCIMAWFCFCISAALTVGLPDAVVGVRVSPGMPPVRSRSGAMIVVRVGRSAGNPFTARPASLTKLRTRSAIDPGMTLKSRTQLSGSMISTAACLPRRVRSVHSLSHRSSIFRARSSSRDAQHVVIGAVEMRDIGFLSLLPVGLWLCRRGYPNMLPPPAPHDRRTDFGRLPTAPCRLDPRRCRAEAPRWPGHRRRRIQAPWLTPPAGARHTGSKFPCEPVRHVRASRTGVRDHIGQLKSLRDPCPPHANPVSFTIWPNYSREAGRCAPAPAHQLNEMAPYGRRQVSRRSHLPSASYRADQYSDLTPGGDRSAV